jgi:hypothetical protein
MKMRYLLVSIAFLSLVFNGCAPTQPIDKQSLSTQPSPSQPIDKQSLSTQPSPFTHGNDKHTMTSLELQSIQSAEFKATKEIAFWSIVSVFRDLGYIIESGDLKTGIITAKSPEKRKAGFSADGIWQTRATAFIEELEPQVTKVRLNFVENENTVFSKGAQSDMDIVIEDAQVYQNAFTKIQEGIIIRSTAK